MTASGTTGGDTSISLEDIRVACNIRPLAGGFGATGVASVPVVYLKIDALSAGKLPAEITEADDSFTFLIPGADLARQIGEALIAAAAQVS